VRAIQTELRPSPGKLPVRRERHYNDSYFTRFFGLLATALVVERAFVIKMARMP
jgi:hypothetical protein